MEALGATAAISQLLGQAIALIKQLKDARERFRDSSKSLEAHGRLLDSLLGTLQVIDKENELQTGSVEKQVEVIRNIAEELNDTLKRQTAINEKSKAAQYIHALTSEEKDENALAKILSRLDHAKTDLTVRIIATNVGLTGDIRNGLVAAWPVIQRIDEKVQQVLGERIEIARTLQDRQSSPEGFISLSGSDIRALKPDIVDEAQWTENEGFEDSIVVNGDGDSSTSHAQSSLKRTYQQNNGHDYSVVLNGRRGGADIATIMAARR